MSAYTDAQCDAAATLYALHWVASDMRRDWATPGGRAALVADFAQYERDFEIILDIVARISEIRDGDARPVDLRRLA